MVIQCPFCGDKVARGARICGRCGQLMVRICPACAEDVGILSRSCKYCDEPLRPEPVAYKPRALRREPARAPAEKPDIEFLDEVKHCPWEDPGNGVFGGWWGTFREASSNPAGFFRKMPVEGGTSKAISFVFTWYAQILLVLEIAAIAVLSPAALGQIPLDPGLYHSAFGVVVAGTVGLPLVYLLTAACLYFNSAIYHMLLRLLGGGGTYEGTLRVLAYSTGAQAWFLVPVLGLIMAPVMIAVMHYHGFRRVHGLSKCRALLIALLPWIIVGGMLTAVLLTVPAGWTHACCW